MCFLPYKILYATPSYISPQWGVGLKFDTVISFLAALIFETMPVAPEVTKHPPKTVLAPKVDQLHCWNGNWHFQHGKDSGKGFSLTKHF